MSEKTCGDCKNFFVHPRDPRDIRLGGPASGECRVEPPKLIQPFLTQKDNGPPQLVGMLVSYLLLNDIFPACGKFEQSEERKDKYQIQLGK